MQAPCRAQESASPVSTPQEPSATRILPFRLRQQAAQPGVPEEPGDRLLGITSIDDPLPGESDGVHHLRAVSLGASSGAFYPHTPTELTPIAASRLELSTVHLMGTARLGTDPVTSVCDLHGKVRDSEQLYVADASLFPGPVGVNPQLTVMALATRVAERIIDTW